MLDVHPPHTSVHTWRDFLIHIATIVVGLLIAVGLEQAVEYFHHRNQLAETREALRQEREFNRQSFAADAGFYRQQQKTYTINLAIFQTLIAHPHTPLNELPGVVHWSSLMSPFQTQAWDSAQRSGISALMPRSEVEQYENFYSELAILSGESSAVWVTVNEAQPYRWLDPDPTHYTPEQLRNEVDLTSKVLTQNFRFGVAMENMASEFPDFAKEANPPTLAEIKREIPSLNYDADPKLAALRDATLAKEDAMRTAIPTPQTR